MNRKVFFDKVRASLFSGSMNEGQVTGMTALIDYFEEHVYSYGYLRWLAYVLATAYLETGKTMLPVRETFADSDAEAVERLERAWKSGKLPWVRNPYWRKDKTGQYPYGRGLAQLTHRVNYERMGKRLDLPLDENYDIALEVDVAVAILWIGSLEGIFTGHALDDFFNAETTDPVGARRIINGTDRAAEIAGYYHDFLNAIDHACKEASTFASEDDTLDDEPTPATERVAALLRKLADELERLPLS